MEKVRLILDVVGHTLTIWLDDPAKEHMCEETADEVVLMKDSAGRVIGVEILNYDPAGAQGGMSVETILRMVA